jgi:spore coat protein U-like protein
MLSSLSKSAPWERENGEGKFMRKLKLAFAMSGAALFWTIAAPATAAETYSSVTLRAVIAPRCTVTTSNLAFGTVDTRSAANRDSAAQLFVTCTNGTNWSASASVGTGSSASFSRRRMSSAAGKMLDYNLYTDPARQVSWGDGTSSGIISARGTGVQQAIPVYGRVFGGQTSVPAGTYSDRITIRISY